MADVAAAINLAAPYYNLALVLIVVYLFIKLFRTRPVGDVYMKPWYLMFAVIVVFIVEEIATVLRAAGVISLTVYINGFFELIMTSLIVYMLLIQREHIKQIERSDKGLQHRR